MIYGEPVEPMAIAHRGGAALAEENTLRAFRLATSLGLRYLETDVRLTRDGHLVCFHDTTLDRVTAGRGRVRDHRLSELSRYLVGGTEPIPTLADALDDQPTACFAVDLKEESAIEPIARVLRHEPYRSRVCVTGAWDGWLNQLRAMVPGVHTALGWRSLTALICSSRLGATSRRRDPSARFAHVPLRVGTLPIFTDRVVERAHQLGVRVVMWTINDPAAMRRLLDIDVDGIITDRPDVLREVLISRASWAPLHPIRQPEHRDIS